MNDVLIEKALDKLQAEVGDKIVELDAKVRDLAQKSQPGWGPGDGGTGGARKSLGATVIEDDAMRALLQGKSRSATVTLPLEIKNVIVGDTGSPATPGDTFSLPNRLGRIVEGRTRQLSILDLLPVEQATSNTVSCTRESDFSNGAAGQTAEGAEKPESSMDFDLVEQPVITLATHIGASRQVLSDAPILRAYIERRLMHFVARALDQQLLTGDGTPGNLSGMLNAGNFTAYAPATGDNQLDSLRNAIAGIQIADYSPSAIVLNPADWRDIELLKDSTDDRYLLAEGGASRYVAGGMDAQLWGLPVIPSNAMPAGEFLVGDFQSAAIFWDRQSVTVEAGFIQDDFIRNRVRMLCELRCALTVNIPAALVSGSLTI
jgi:HK97 family phage major capsid protein